MSEVHRGRSQAWRSPAGDVLAKDIVKIRLWLGALDTLNAADGHIVDHGTAYFPMRRFPRLPDIYRRTRSVTRGLVEFGITDGARKPARVLACFSRMQVAKRTHRPHGKPVRRVPAMND
jgi:GntR family transcriptional regulator, phosphonate transport system regulatory protein